MGGGPFTSTDLRLALFGVAGVAVVGALSFVGVWEAAYLLTFAAMAVSPVAWRLAMRGFNNGRPMSALLGMMGLPGAGIGALLIVMVDLPSSGMALDEHLTTLGIYLAPPVTVYVFMALALRPGSTSPGKPAGPNAGPPPPTSATPPPPVPPPPPPSPPAPEHLPR